MHCIEKQLFLFVGHGSLTLVQTQGDADLFVNPSSKGFYHRTNIMAAHPDPQPVWTSQRPSGLDSVVVTQSDADYVKDGGSYLVTVYGYVSSEFNLRVTVAGTVTTLVEQFPTTAVIKAGGYQYFRFYDTNPSKGLVFNLNPTVGDADLFVSCSVLPTGTDQGEPNNITLWCRSLKHYGAAQAFPLSSPDTTTSRRRPTWRTPSLSPRTTRTTAPLRARPAGRRATRSTSWRCTATTTPRTHSPPPTPGE